MFFFPNELDSHPTQTLRGTQRNAHTISIAAHTHIVTFTALLVRSQFIARVTGTLEAAESVYTPLFTSTIVWLGTLILL